MSVFLKDFEMQQQYFTKKISLYRNVALSQYRNVALSQYRFIAILLAKIARLTRALI
jgi:hypothetical protein